jgi:cellulose synthase operon protein C
MVSAMRTIVRAACGVTLLALSITLPPDAARGQTNTTPATQQYDAAVALQNRGAYESAAEEWAKFIDTYKTDPRCDRAFHYLGVCYLKADKLDLARRCFEIVIEHFPKFELLDATYLDLGVTQYNLARSGKPEMYDEAAASFQAVIARFPDGKHVAEALYYRGESLYHRGKKPEAVEMYTQLLAKFPDDHLAVDSLYALGVSRDDLGQHAEAETAYRQFLEKYPKDSLAAEVTMRRAAALMAMKQYAEAAALYAAIAAKYSADPLAPQALYMAGFTALGQGDFMTSLKHATAFLAAYPDNRWTAEATYVAAESHLQLGQFADAEKLFAELLQKHPDHADAETWTIRRGLSLYMQKKYAETIALLRPIVAKLHAPDALAEVDYLLGGSQVELKQSEAAVKSLEASLAAQPKGPHADDSLLLLAQAYGDLNRGEKADAALERLITEFPDSRLLETAHYRLAENAYAAGHFTVATTEYRQVLDRWPQSPLAPHVLYGLGWVNLSENDPAAAEKLFDELLHKYPNHKLIPRVRYARGMARCQLKDFAQAIDDLDALLATDPTPTEKSDARYLLGLCQAGLQKQADAVATFQTLLKDDPKYTGADRVLYELAWALKQQGKEKESAEAFAQLTVEQAESPLAAEAQYHVGEFAYQSGDLKSAAASYHAAWQRAGQTELGQKAAFLEGESLLKQKNFTAALAAYEQVKNPPGQDFEAILLLHAGQAAAQLAKWDKSLELLTKCIEQFPDAPALPEALCEQAWAKQNLGKLDEATVLYEKVLAKTDCEAAARAQFLIGTIQFQQKNYTKAIKSFSIVIDGYSYPQWQSEAAYEAGRCFEALNKKEQAVKQYRELVEKYPGSEKVSSAKQRIEELRKQDTP